MRLPSPKLVLLILIVVITFRSGTGIETNTTTTTSSSSGNGGSDSNLNNNNEEQQTPQPRARLDCDPCIDRPSFYIKVITHGNNDGGPSLFWNQVKSAAQSAAQLLRIELEFDLYDTFDPHQMKWDILYAVNANASTTTKGQQQRRPDALLVTIPSPVVHDAIKFAVQQGIPVFGINSGREVAMELGLLGFFSMDEYEGGVQAAKQFLKIGSSGQPSTTAVAGGGVIQRALFVNQEKGNTALDARFLGFKNTLQQASSMTGSHHNATSTEALQTTVIVEEFALQMNQNRTLQELFLRDMLTGCPYDAILLGGESIREFVTSALYGQGCSTDRTLLGTFDTSTAVYDAIAVGKLHFAISQQQHLQGMLGVLMATLYATSKKRLLFAGREHSVDNDNNRAPLFSTGPKVITIETLPPDTSQICETDAFPVCPHKLDPLGVEESKCPCVDFSKITIAAVLHGSKYILCVPL